MSESVSFQEVIEYVEALSLEEQELLFELIKKRRVEQQRMEIARNASETLEAIETGRAKRGSLAQLQANLQDEE